MTTREMTTPELKIELERIRLEIARTLDANVPPMLAAARQAELVPRKKEIEAELCRRAAAAARKVSEV